jgi:hypothetical protein
MVILAYCWQRHRRWLPPGAIVLAVPVLMLFNVLGHNRNLLKNFFTGEQSWEETNVLRPGMSAEEIRNRRYDTQDFANFDYLCFVVMAYSNTPDSFSYGAQYLQLFTEPIPRILWRGKPAGSPVPSKVNIRAFGNFIGLTVSLPGDGYVSGGWLGVVITLTLCGMIAGKCHRWFWNHCNQPIPGLFYLSGLAVSPQWYRDGGIGIFKFLLWSLLPIIVWRGVLWWLDGRPLEGNSITLRAGDRLRLVQS